MLGHDAVEGFFETSAESSVLPPTKIYMLANFSGLTLTDINTIAKFSQNPIPSSCTIRPDYSGSCVKGIKGCNTEHPLWNRKNTVEPNVENEYFKQIQEKMSGLDIGASMNKLENILNTFESKIKDIK